MRCPKYEPDGAPRSAQNLVLQGLSLWVRHSLFWCEMNQCHWHVDGRKEIFESRYYRKINCRSTKNSTIVNSNGNALQQYTEKKARIFGFVYCLLTARLIGVFHIFVVVIPLDLCHVFILFSFFFVLLFCCPLVPILAKSGIRPPNFRGCHLGCSLQH